MNTWSDERLAWLALHMVDGLGSQGFKNLLDVFGSPEAVFAASPEAVLKVEGLKKQIADRIFRRQFVSDPEDELKKVEKYQARIITFSDPEYPWILKEIAYPPMILYARGKNMPPNKTYIAVVGSRIPTHYGLKSAERIGEGLAGRGIGVVSGLARGIDSAAHRGCLKGKGFTIAVFGTGIDVLYPSGNERLMERIIDNGIAITEFPMGTPPEPKNFPIRNRIISGLSRGVVVVEATKRSGSLITASFALDQGREVFAVPGSIHSFKSTGTHLLIKQGAKLIENAEDILEEIGLSYKPEQPGPLSKDRAFDLDESERKIYEFLGDYPQHIDEIVRQLGMNPGEALGVLMRLELSGLVKQLPGKMFVTA